MIIYTVLRDLIKEKLGYPLLVAHEQEVFRTGAITSLPVIILSLTYENEKVEGNDLYATMNVSLMIISNHTTVDSYLLHHDICRVVFQTVNKFSKDEEFNTLSFIKLKRSFQRENTKNGDVLITTQLYQTFGRVYTNQPTLYAHGVKPNIIEISIRKPLTLRK